MDRIAPTDGGADVEPVAAEDVKVEVVEVADEVSGIDVDIVVVIVASVAKAAAGTLASSTNSYVGSNEDTAISSDIFGVVFPVLTLHPHKNIANTRHISFVYFISSPYSLPIIKMVNL